MVTIIVLILCSLLVKRADSHHKETKSYKKVRETKELPPCNEDQLMIYLAEIQAINPESIINLSTLGHLTNLCNKVYDNLIKVDKYLKTCDPPQQKDLYVQLIKGVDSLYQTLCVEGPLKKNFEKHYECVRDLHTDFQECVGPADWTEDSDDKKVCKAYQDISDCYYAKTAKLCGQEAADVMKKLILAVINSVITVKCDQVPKSSYVEEVMPEENKSGQSITVISPTILTLYFTLFYHTL